jgi:Short-chain dehydrogenases of various substrate specificities
MAKQVSVLVGAGSIGQAIIRRVSAGKHVVLADYSVENAERAAKTLEDAGFECSTLKCNLGSKEDILKLVEFATSKGEVTNVVNAAGVSPSPAPVAGILRVDLYGTSVLLEEFRQGDCRGRKWRDYLVAERPPSACPAAGAKRRTGYDSV